MFTVGQRKNSNGNQERPLSYIQLAYWEPCDNFSLESALSCFCEVQTFQGTLASNVAYPVQADLSPLSDCGGLVVKNNCAVLLFCLLAALPAFSAQHVALHPRSGFDSAEQETIRQIVDMERQAKEASLRRDADFSLRTLADDYVAITPLGQVTTKQETISARRSGQLRYESMNVSDMVVRLYGDTAVVTARADVKGRQLGEDFSGPYRYTRVWVRRNGRWQTVSYQATVTQ
jgi:ketosteroid isomerase-like protein